MSQQFTVDVQKIIFGPSPESFVILICHDPKTGDKFIAKGTVHAVEEGGTLSFTGQWTEDKKYGKQVQILGVSVDDNMSIEALLSSGMIEGMSSTLGKKVFAHFGDDFPNIMRDEPARLLEVKGVTADHVKAIERSWERMHTSKGALAVFLSAGVTTRMLKRIDERWASLNAAFEAIKGNAYILTLVSGIPFTVSDKIAEHLGKQEKNPHRGLAAVIVTLRKNEKNGHCFMYLDHMVSEAQKLTDETWYANPAFLDMLVNTGYVTAVKDGGSTKVYRTRTHDAEFVVGTTIAEMTKRRTIALPGAVEKLMAVNFMKHDGSTYTLDAVQAQAVVMACTNAVSVITGGPGTGKTTVLQALLHALRTPDICGIEFPKDTIKLCAPTGKAARRMSESTGWQATTIHKLLGLRKDDEDSEERVTGALDQDTKIVIVDESSMIDIELFCKVIEAMPEGCGIVIVGDVDQLPSIGPGLVLKDIINSSVVPTTYLKAVYRQSEGSCISGNARAVITGACDDIRYRGVDFAFVETSRGDYDAEADAVLATLAAALSTGLTMADVMVLSPMYKGAVGVTALNTLIQNEYNPNSHIVYSGRSLIFREGDKVMQTVNDYDKGVYNGDVGRIVSYDEFEAIMFDPELEEQTSQYTHIKDTIKIEPLALVYYGDKHVVPYKLGEVPEHLTLAYAMTVHKAQGSESPVVIQIVSETQTAMLYRQLVYTAMTRARHMLYVVGTYTALEKAVQRTRNMDRNTRLRQLVRA